MNVQTKICTHIENTQELIIEIRKNAHIGNSQEMLIENTQELLTENTQERTRIHQNWSLKIHKNTQYTGIDNWKCSRKELHQTLNSSSGHQFSCSTASAIHSRKREVAREAQSPKTRGKTANTNNKTESTQSTCVTWYRYEYNVAREVWSKCKMPCSSRPTQGGP